jgi:hypothetical protein
MYWSNGRLVFFNAKSMKALDYPISSGGAGCSPRLRQGCRCRRRSRRRRRGIVRLMAKPQPSSAGVPPGYWEGTFYIANYA